MTKWWSAGREIHFFWSAGHPRLVVAQAMKPIGPLTAPEIVQYPGQVPPKMRAERGASPCQAKNSIDCMINTLPMA